MTSDTIAAIATANGIGSIAIIRLSGDMALDIAKKLSKKEDFSPRYATLTNIYDSSDVAKIYDCHGDVGLVNSQGKLVYPVVAERIQYTKSDNVFLVRHSEERNKLINNKGKAIIDIFFDEIKEEDKNIFKVKRLDKYGLVNNRGEYIFEVEYDIIEVYKKFIKLHRYFSTGLADYNGNYILNIEWVSINILDEFIIFTKNKQSGVMNHNQEILLEHGRYCESSIQIRKHPKNGRELVEYGTIFKTGLIDSHGNEVIPFMNNFKYNLVQTKFFKELW